LIRIFRFFLPTLLLLSLAAWIFPEGHALGGDPPHSFSDADLTKYRRRSDSQRPSAPRNMWPTQEAGADEKPSLKVFTVPYQPLEGSARRIIVPVTLNGSVTARMALDTGAPGMVISERLAQRLGVFERDDEKLIISASGIGGTVPAILTIVDTARIGQVEDRFIPTQVTSLPDMAFEGLIGMDFRPNVSVQ